MSNLSVFRVFCWICPQRFTSGSLYTSSNTFPSKAISDSEVELSKAHDHHLKEKREQAVNSSKYKKPSDIKIGDLVILKNFNQKSKFDPIFLPDQYMVTDATDHGRKLVVKRTSDNQLLIRHPDDVKPFQLSTASTNIESNHSYPDLWKPLMEESSEYDGWYYFIPPHQAYVPLAAVPAQQGQQYQINAPHPEIEQNQADAPHPHNQQDQIHHPVQEELNEGRPVRQRHPPERLGAHSYNEDQPLEGEDNTTAPWWPGYPKNNV